MSEQLYERYIREGADALTLDEVRRVLRWRSNFSEGRIRHSAWPSS
jgi:hypothetical protein